MIHILHIHQSFCVHFDYIDFLLALIKLISTKLLPETPFHGGSSIGFVRNVTFSHVIISALFLHFQPKSRDLHKGDNQIIYTSKLDINEY